MMSSIVCGVLFSVVRLFSMLAFMGVGLSLIYRDGIMLEAPVGTIIQVHTLLLF